MKTLVILSCYSAWHLWLFFFLGMMVMAIVSVIIRIYEKQMMKEKRDLLKLSHAIQRYYWLVKKGKATQANKKALKKIISVFSNRVIYASPSAVEYALSSFRVGVFDSLRTKISEVYHSYKSQFQASSDYGEEDSLKFTIPISQKNLITSEDAIDCIQKAFEEAEVK